MLTVGKVGRRVPAVRQSCEISRLALLVWLIVAVKMAVLLTGCGPAPTFTTTQGVDVYVDDGVRGVERGNTSAALAIIISEARTRKPVDQGDLNVPGIMFVFHKGQYVTASNGEQAAGLDRGGIIEIAAEYDACPFSVLSHEWGHVLAGVHGDGDPHHKDFVLFWMADSLEVVAKARVRLEVCDYNKTEGW